LIAMKPPTAALVEPRVESRALSFVEMQPETRAASRALRILLDTACAARRILQRRDGTSARGAGACPPETLRLQRHL